VAARRGDRADDAQQGQRAGGTGAAARPARAAHPVRGERRSRDGDGDGDATAPAAADGSSCDAHRPLVIAPANDWERDWTALARAAALVPELDVRIVAAPARVRIDGLRPANLEVGPTSGDVDQLASRLRELASRERDRLPPTAVERGLTGSDYAARHVLLTSWLLESSGERDSRVEEFVPVKDVLPTA
jgi:hypothetical protein